MSLIQIGLVDTTGEINVDLMQSVAAALNVQGDLATCPSSGPSRPLFGTFLMPPRSRSVSGSFVQPGQATPARRGRVSHEQAQPAVFQGHRQPRQ